MLLFAAGAFGAILGSFLNAFLFRYNTGRSVMRGRSACMHCSSTLAAEDLIPVVSYVLLRGKCRYCRSRISPQYPLIEALSALFAVLIYLRYQDPAAFLFWFLVWETLLFVLVYDLRHKIIPWAASGLLALLGLVHVYLGGMQTIDLIAGPLLALPLFLVSAVSGGRWMGWGDSALELGIGWLLGISVGLTAFMLSFWIGALVGIVLLTLTKRYTMRSEVPFAPFLIVGAALVFFLNVDLFPTLPTLFF